MTWYDGLVLVLFLGLVAWETRQEAGRALLDTVATLAALHMTTEYAPHATALLRLQPLAGTQMAPGAQALCFLGFWSLGLLVSAQLHRLTRWSMDNFDPVFGMVFGLVVAIGVGHAFTDITARMMIQRHNHLPAYMRESLLSEEFRSLRTYHYVLNACQTRPD